MLSVCARRQGLLLSVCAKPTLYEAFFASGGSCAQAGRILVTSARPTVAVKSERREMDFNILVSFVVICIPQSGLFCAG